MKMIFFKKLSLWFLILIVGVSKSTFAQEKLGIAFLPADESNVSIFIVLDDLPEQYFLFTVPEIITSRNFKQGMFNADMKAWTIKNNQATRKVKKGPYKYQVMMTLQEEKDKFWVNWQIKFENNSKDTLVDIAAFNCLTMHHAPLFKDTTMIRTWVRNNVGEVVSLKDVAKVQGEGRRTMQFYPASGGLDLSESPWLRDWRVISPTQLSGNTMWLNSIDGKWKVETIVDGQTAYFFNNWEGDHGCIHASPLIAKELKPMQTAVVKGRFVFSKMINN